MEQVLRLSALSILLPLLAPVSALAVVRASTPLPVLPFAVVNVVMA
jgi:hypothetical protein